MYDNMNKIFLKYSIYNLFFIKYFVFIVNYVIKKSLGFMEINIVYIIKILVKYFYIKRLNIGM